ncbi:MAG: 30S ribosomal protein S8 [Gammaproteobacteria bacterium]|nr:30S ribosomal protein S8 [Gammaproteobacteria bacterium]|tara:strand:+ start:4332 stop:4730 length:399 start_codon:yes stop_codon:yes gene_type:complete
MTMNDPIADMLTRIRNAHKIRAKRVLMPSSKIKINIAKVLLKEGYIKGFEEEEIKNGKKDLSIDLKYYEGSPVIEKIDRVSRPGLRIYKTRTELPKVMGGLGIAIVSTSKGIMSDKDAREQGEGGEILCFIA